MRYKLAIFDMDGTILDTLEDLADSVNHIMDKNGYKTHSIDAVRGFVGNGIGKLIERALPADCSEKRVKEVVDEFMPYYKEHCAIKTRPYDGIVEAITHLKEAGVKTAVVSNKGDIAVQKLCEQYFNGLFDMALGERPEVKRKPAPDMCQAVMAELGFAGREADAVYIGDSEVDIETAANSNLDAIVVSWGFRDKDFQLAHGARRIVDSPKEIVDIILQ